MNRQPQPYAHYPAFFSDYRNPIDFLRFISDCRLILEHATKEDGLCGEYPDRPPVLSENTLILGSKHNTSPFSLLKLSLHEPWPAHRFPMTIVRTDRHAYDRFVCACLMAFKHHFPAAEITSDGSRKEWAGAIAMYEFITERSAPKLDIRPWDLENPNSDV